MVATPPSLPASPSASPAKRRSEECPGQSVDQPITKRPRTHGPEDTSALLYHSARAAHLASQVHLQEAFIPRLEASAHPIPHYALDQEPVLHDPHAAERSLALQVFALDLLRIGLSSDSLTLRERAAFTVEFATIGCKVLESGLFKHESLGRDISASVAQMLALCEHNPQLKFWRRHLEWLNVKVTMVEGRVTAGKRLIRQYIQYVYLKSGNKATELTLSRSDAAHRHSLRFLQMQYGDLSDVMSCLSDVETASLPMSQLSALIKTCRLFEQRRWDDVSSALAQFASTIGWNEAALTTSGSSEDVEWHLNLLLHYAILRCLWEGRLGNGHLIHALLKRLHLTMDEGLEFGRLENIRRNGGLIQVPGSDLWIQSTAPNVTFLATFLATVTARREFVGLSSSCKSLMHSRAMRDYEAVSRKDDMWDTGFHSMHGLEQVQQVSASVNRIRAEIRLEEATALICRSSFGEAQQLLNQILEAVKRHRMGHLHPHLCFLHAQYAQLLGYEIIALRYYQAALNMLVPGTELGLLIQACMLGVRGAFEASTHDHVPVAEVHDLAHKCKRSTSAMLAVVGHFLLAFSDKNLMLSKRHIQAVYDLCQRSENNVLRAVVFAFTSTTHLTGNEERVQKQLETGLEIAKLLGGRDRPDGVGQSVLGLWFACKLRSVYNRNQDVAQVALARSTIQRHRHRLDQIMEFGRSRFAQSSRLGMMQM